MESSQKSIIGQGTVNRAGQAKPRLLSSEPRGLVQVQRSRLPWLCLFFGTTKRMKRQEQLWRSFKGAFTLGIRDFSVESPNNTMLVI